jgi:hypothetical protein
MFNKGAGCVLPACDKGYTIGPKITISEQAGMVEALVSLNNPLNVDLVVSILK